ncbi:FkbM family methyltransferase [Rhodobacteraceae bacterium M382]|nr:FkbM family methyltransferase [Rhodobacteraceae bacterium M382]
MRFLKGVERGAKKLVPNSWRKYFRASKYELLMRRRAPIDLVVHVGAHWAEDAWFYEECGARTVLWVEADPDTFSKLQGILADRNGTTRHLCENALVSAEAGEEVQFNRFNGDGSSSSIHASTDTYRERFPHSQETGEVLALKTRTLPDILARHGIDLDQANRSMLVVDVQGHELPVLRGLGDLLQQFAQCKCEVSRVPMYEGGSKFEDIDAHMKARGFRLASHRYVQVPRHGDVLYIKD